MTRRPADHAGGATDLVEVLVGYLVTLRDGTQCRLAPDLTAARQYYAQRHAAGFESMFVRRPAAAPSVTQVTHMPAVGKGAAPGG